MNEITYRGRAIGHVEAEIVDTRPKFPIEIKHGRTTLLPDGDDRERYYNGHFELHQAGSVTIRTLPQAPLKKREYPRAHAEDGFSYLWMKTTVQFDSALPESLAMEMTEDGSAYLLHIIVPLVRQTILRRLNRLAGDSTEHIQIPDDLADEMIRQHGIAPIRPYHPIYREWKPKPAKKRQIRPPQGVRTLNPVLLKGGERMNRPNLSVNTALLENTEHTPVRESTSWISSTHRLPAAVLRDVSCTVNGRHVPAKDIMENTLTDALELTIDLMSPEDVETIKVKAPFFLDSLHASDPLFTGQRGTLLVSAEAKITVEDVMRHITPVLSRFHEDEYRTSLIQMLMGPELASKTALRHIASRSMRSLYQAESAIERAIIAGESVRNGDYIVTYQPEDQEPPACPCP